MATIGTMNASKQDEAFSKMQTSLSKYARANDRRMVLRSMRDVKYLKCIALETTSAPRDSLQASEEELLTEENIVLNGVPFDGSNHFLSTLKELCAKVCDQDGVWMESDALYDNLVTRMARSNASADSFFKLNPLVGSPDLILMPTSYKHAFPIKLNLYVANGQIHTTLSTTNSFGLFRKADVKPADLGGLKASSSRPWIGIHAVVDERSNVSNGQAVRHVKVLLPENLY
mmetsp:Transcript_6050/g.6604  ORF Transcript_6050/g.6604 Transcript_6050/m.6604 type:complete len:230 (+) Transcript_6050:185-874(+)